MLNTSASVEMELPPSSATAATAQSRVQPGGGLVTKTRNVSSALQVCEITLPCYSASAEDEELQARSRKLPCMKS